MSTEVLIDLYKEGVLDHKTTNVLLGRLSLPAVTAKWTVSVDLPDAAVGRRTTVTIREVEAVREIDAIEFVAKGFTIGTSAHWKYYGPGRADSAGGSFDVDYQDDVLAELDFSAVEE